MGTGKGRELVEMNKEGTPEETWEFSLLDCKKYPWYDAQKSEGGMLCCC